MRHRYSVRSFILCALTIIALASAQAIFAQTTVFAYQGKLDIDGVPANGNYDFQFRVFDAESGGAQQGTTEQQPNITVTKWGIHRESRFRRNALLAFPRPFP